MRPKLTTARDKIISFAKAALFYLGAAIFIIAFVLAGSIVQIFGLYLLEIVLFGNALLMFIIIPIGVYLRK